MMKHISALLSCILLIAMLAAGCSSRNTPSQPDIPSASASEPVGSTATPEVSSEPPEASSLPEESSEADTIETAAFALGNAGDPHEIAEGDSIGDWTLADLKITYMDDGSLTKLSALFEGNITLKGTIAPSVFTENRFDFRVAAADKGKMPCYIAPDETPKDEIWIALNIPDTIADTLNIEGEVECEITVSDYRFVFAYMMAPASATVVDVDLVE